MKQARRKYRETKASVNKDLAATKNIFSNDEVSQM
jgi:hypothetical protein